MPESLLSYKISIMGRVQGVAFRKHSKIQADNLGIFGFVRNLPDGTVYIEAEGTETKLDQYVLWCYEGSPFSRVDKVEIKKGPTSNYRDFAIVD